MIFDEHDLAGAVLLLSDDYQLIREMNYAEYQAVIDGYVPIVDLAGAEVNAVYVEMNARYRVKNIVFFLLTFTADGFIDHSQYVPLFQLSQRSMTGPDLGSGTIGLVSSNRCPVKHYRHALWEPEESRFDEVLQRVADAIARNTLGIVFRSSHLPPTPDKSFSFDISSLEERLASDIRREMALEYKEKLAEGLRAQREDFDAQLHHKEHQMTSASDQQDNRIEEYKQLLEAQKRLLHDEQQRSAVLKETVDGQVEKIKGLREYFEVKLEQLESAAADREVELTKAHSEKLEHAVAVATAELKDLVKMRDVAVMYRHEQEVKLQREITQLIEENNRLAQQGGAKFLAAMVEKGISFMTYQPGAGHISLTVENVKAYMENPSAFIAEYCKVDESQYSAWLSHFQVPICRAVTEDGAVCGANIARTEVPRDFVVGVSDCCAEHRRNSKPKLIINT